MKDLVLLWIDLTIQKPCISTTKYFEGIFQVRHNSLDAMSDGAEFGRPHALCFDFDFPDRSGLKLLEDTKLLHPSIPILMLTVQHSEELAVWAFRNRVWDYFAKPVQRSDVESCYEALCKINPTESNRRSVRIKTSVPSENNYGFKPGNEKALIPAVAYIKSHYSEKLSLGQLAAMCGMSPFRFSRLFHSELGQTFQDYLLHIRIKRAEDLLKNPLLSISDIGDAVGFNDVSYFGRVFRKLHEMSPTQWRHHYTGDTRPHLHVDDLY